MHSQDVVCTDEEFVRLLCLWRPFGGLERLQSQACAMRFRWHLWWWAPELFLRPSVRTLLAWEVVRELQPAFDNLDIIRWCVEPNEWLDGDPPAARLDARGQHSVVEAARLDRFIAAG